MYKRKTVDCYAIESFYEGHGWSIECNCEDLKDAKVQLKTYRENVNYPVRIKKWREGGIRQMELKKYITYEEPLEGKSFTINQLHEVYRDLVDKEEYQDFDCWFTDMLKSGVFETI